MIILSGVYRALVKTGERVLPQTAKRIIKWDHPAGPKTIFFWAPLMKWSLVIAGLGDLARPADKLSKNQSISLAATGLIWSRYSMVIIPKNWMLFAVNAFLAVVAINQITRIYIVFASILKMIILSSVYRALVKTGDRILSNRVKSLIKWDHPAGPKTIFFWSPLAKMSLVVAGIGDLTRPADKLSTNQSLTLAATGLIWSRYSLVITPKCLMLFGVNMFLALIAINQLTRIYL